MLRKLKSAINRNRTQQNSSKMYKISKRMCILAVYLAAVLINLSIAQADMFEGNPCKLHTGVWGVCKNSNHCKWLIQSLEKKRMRYSDIKICGFTQRNEDIVCCGDEKPNKIPATPSDFTFLFDMNTAHIRPTKPIAQPPTDRVTGIDVIPNKSSGSKAIEACAKYSKMATVFFPSSIINGRPAQLTEFPHMAALGYRNSDSNGYDFDCGASLIAEQWVVTAAHCVKERRQPVIVRMGKVTLHNNDDGADAEDRVISKIIRHPDYQLSRKKNDIALVQFEGSIRFNDIVRPACIYTDINDVPESKELIIAGWGSIEAERTSRPELLLKANVSSVPLDSCNRTLVEFNQFADNPSLRALSLSQMCAFDTIEKSDACQGDSGGPIFLNERSTGVSTVVGIISFGVSCGTELPGVYTRIAFYLDWIEKIVWP